MTQHELLAFVSDLRDFLAASEREPGPWSWPTHEQLTENLKGNADVFGPNILQEVPDALRTAQRRRWIIVGGCTSRGAVRCHARHYRVTDAGLEMLRLFDEQGCDHHGIKAKRRRTVCARVTWPAATSEAVGG